MKYLKLKDLKRRSSFLRKEKSIVIHKFISINYLTHYKRLSSKSLQYFRKKKKNFFNRIVNRCVFTNNSRSTNRSVKLSRKIFRDLLRSGFIPGYKKAV